MTDSRRYLLPFCFILALSVAPQALMAASTNQNSVDISDYLPREKIAIDPVLLQIQDLEKIKQSSDAPSTLHSQPPSELEKIYSDRLRERIDQFGYDLFPATPQEPSSASVQDSYILGPGDEISILLRGSKSANTTITIEDDGLLVIDTLPPIHASGKSLRAVKDELRTLTKDIYNTDLFVSVSKTRRMTITVSGDVTQPGQITLSTYNTVLDALGAVGGVKKTGTLRQIKLIRNNQTHVIDLYGILIYGSSTTDISLRDGDRIVVSPIGPTLAVSGASKRPAIYEILPANLSVRKQRSAISQKLTLGDMLDLSGGALLPSKTRYLRLNLENRSVDSVSDVTHSDARIFGDGDILLINQSGLANQDLKSGSVQLSGETPQAGLYALAEAPSLSRLLKDEKALGSDIYPLIAVIERWNPGRLSKELIAFSPLQIISRQRDVPLHESDVVILFSRNDILNFETPEEIDSPHEKEDEKEIEQQHQNNDKKRNKRKRTSGLSNDIQKFLIEHAVFLRGSIRAAGSYPVAKETTLDDLLSVSGGASLEADMRNVEITQPRADKTSQRIQIDLALTSPSSISLHPGDTVRVGQTFRRIEDRHVLLTGEVRNPGTYDLIPGDTLSTLIKRAGGITNEAYPKGTIFSRKSERLREEQRYKAQARTLELSLASALQHSQTDKRPNDQEITLARNLIDELKGAEVLGRITVEADPALLDSQADLDILLESGDKIFIPKRPLTVRVAGEVLSPASLQFRSGKSPRDYIDEAGGFAYNADQDRAFVVYPDGSAQPLSVSAWNYKATLIPPGSTIIVPQDPKPLTFMDGAKDLSQILANLATTAIFAEDMTDGN